MQRGVIHLMLPVIIVALVGLGIFIFIKNKADNLTVVDKSENNAATSEEIVPVIENGDTGTTVTITPTKALEKVPPTSTPVPTQKAVQKTSGVCGINVLVSDSNPLELRLVYSLSNSNNAYMTEAQWDFNGDGSWDTGWSQSNGSINYNFQNAGTYNVFLHLKMSDGMETGVCTKSVTVPQGFQVSFSGRVFGDINCNNMWDPGENFISGVTVNIFRKPGFSLYKTLTTDSGGNFSFSTLLNSGENLTVSPGAVAPPYYKIYHSTADYTLNSSHTDANMTLSIVPAENVGSCN